MHNLISGHFKNVRLMVLFVIIAFVSTLNSAEAQSRIFDFYIENPASVEVKVTLFAGSCYEGSMPNNEEWVLAPGEKIKLGILARVQGHGCDGENGHFRLEFSPKHKDGNDLNFYFDNAGSLWVSGDNRYPGKLNPKSGNSYTFSTYDCESSGE